MGKGDNYRPVDQEKFGRNYDRIFGEQQAPAHDAPWDDEACDRGVECPDCQQAPCQCDYERT